MGVPPRWHGRSVLGRGGLEQRFPVLCRCDCACALSTTHPRVLCLTGLLFALPAIALWHREGDALSRTLGALCGLLATTSLAYHSTHDPRCRALDVVVLWTLVVVCTACTARWTRPRLQDNGLLALALVAPAASALICASERTHFRRRDTGRPVLRMEWHAALHALNAAGVALLAAHGAAA